jgi:hypothetical protein
MSFALYLTGFLILIGGLIYGALLLHVAPHWIAASTVVLVGLGILMAVQRTRSRDA